MSQSPSVQSTNQRILGTLREEAAKALVNAFTPYSGEPAAAILLLSDGTLVPGVRIESASFSLVIPPVLNALTTATTAGRQDVAALVASRPLLDGELAFVASSFPDAFTRAAPDALLADPAAPLPELQDRLDPFLPAAAPVSDMAGVILAREVAARAWVPESAFPVGCVLETSDGLLIPGCNVEYSDWSRILCAERNALGTAVTYGIRSFRKLYLSCPKAAACSPCGACRQVIAELASSVPVIMDRGDFPPAVALPEELLPGFFAGDGIETRTIRKA